MTAGLDTDLARALAEARRLEVELLQRMLAEARAGRPGGRTLADLLVLHGHLDLDEVCAYGPPGEDVGQTTAPGAPGAALAGRAHPWPVGALVAGRYRVAAHLGCGGMGFVVRAVDVTSGAPRALKTLRALDDAEVVARFVREGEAQARVDAHPNVVRVLDLADDGGRPVLVLEYVRGGTLAEALRRDGPLSVARALDVGLQVARALAHLHARGVVHRDLKPANVLLAGEVAKVSDFGVAHLADADRLTRTSELLGSPAYMAPEQVTGTQPVGPASDVHALGALLHEALVGAPVFARRSVPETLAAVVHTAPPAPGRSRPDVPAALDVLVRSALAKDPARRPTAAGLVEAFEALRRAPEAPRAPGVPRALVALALLATLSAAAALLHGAGREAPPPAVAAPPPPAPLPPAPALPEEAQAAPVVTALPVWTWAQGERRTFRLRLRGNDDHDDEPFELVRSYDLQWEAEAVDERSLRLTVTPRAVLAQATLLAPPAETIFEHQSPRGDTGPLAALLDVRFSLVLDPFDGALRSTDLEERAWPRVEALLPSEEDDPLVRDAYRSLREVRERDDLLDAVGALTHLGPISTTRDGWTVVRRWRRGEGHLRLQVTRGAGGRLDFSGEGRGEQSARRPDYRKAVEGHAVVDARGVVRAEARERTTWGGSPGRELRLELERLE